MNEPLSGKEFEEAVKNRQDARKMMHEAATNGDEICGSYLALILSDPLAKQIDELSDYDDSDEDDIRPY